MAWRPGRSSSTINRELARNRLPFRGYRPSFAEGSYLARRERLTLLELDERLEWFVIDRLRSDAVGLVPALTVQSRRPAARAERRYQPRYRPVGVPLLRWMLPGEISRKHAEHWRIDPVIISTY